MQSRRGGDRRALLPLVHSASGYNNQCQARPKPQAENSILLSHVAGRVPNTWSIFCYLPRIISREQDRKQSSWDLNQHCQVMLAYQAVA